jgi:hypothetical protein
MDYPPNDGQPSSFFISGMRRTERMGLPWASGPLAACAVVGSRRH